MGFVDESEDIVSGKFCFAIGLVGAILGQFIAKAFLSMHFVGELISLSALALAGYGSVCLLGLNKRWAKMARRLKKCFLAALVLFFFSFACIQGVIVAHSYSEPYDGDLLIVLGAGLYGSQPSASLISRLQMARDYLECHPQAVAILSGGQGPGEDISEAEAMRRYLVQSGIANDRLLLESRSTNTRENLLYSRELLTNEEHTTQVSLAIVTNDFHQYRAQALARQLNLQTFALAAPTPDVPGLEMNCYIREYFAVVKFYLQSLWLL